MKTDSLIEAINGIKDDYVTEYDPTESVGTGSGKVISIDSRRMKGVNGMKKISIWLSAAAAVLVLGVGIFAINHFVKNSGSEHHAAVPTEQTASVPTEQTALLPTEEVPRVVTGKNGSLDNQVATVGQRLIEYSLEDAIKAPENEGCLFDVELWIYNFAEVDAYVEEQWAKVIDKQNDPAILRYNEEYEYWLENIYEPTEDDIKAQENGKGREAEYFAAYWAENYSQEMQDAYTAAVDAAREARAEYDANTGVEALKQMKEAAMAKLLTALAEIGYELEQGETLNDVIYKANGLLTREQIESFPVQDCGVFILWNGYEGGIDE